jgi:Glycosyltransferase family 87
MRAQRLAWLGVMLALSVGGSAAALWAAKSSQYFLDVTSHSAYAQAFDLPIRVVQAAYPGWNVVIAVWAMLAALTVAGLLFVRAAGESSRGPIWLLGGFLLVGAALSFFAIVQSSDIYYYVMYGRIYAVHGLNPYVLAAPLDIKGDPALAQILAFANNPPYADPYGPLWTLVAGGLARVEQSASLWTQAWTHRAVAIVAGGATLGAVLFALRDRPLQERVTRAGRFAFHPLVLYETAVGGHNDALMVAPIAWALVLVDTSPLIAGLLAGAAIAVKYAALVALPFVVARAAKAGWLTAALVLIVALALPLLCLQPFSVGGEGTRAVAQHAGLISMSALWLAAMPFFAAGVAQQPIAGWLPDLPVIGALTWPRAIELTLLAAAAAIIAYSIARYRRTQSRHELWRSISALLWSLPAMHPWYGEWLMPAVAGRGAWAAYAWWLGVLLLGLYVADGVSAAALRTWVLVAITLAYLAIPVVMAVRAARLERARAAAGVAT